MKAKNRFFPHDFNARNDINIQRLMNAMGCEGVGIYWCLVEMLYEQGGFLPWDSLPAIAYSLHIKSAKLERVVKDFDLFEYDDDSKEFWSSSVIRRQARRKDLAEKRSVAARKRWIDNDASAMQMQSKCNANAIQLQSNCNASAMQMQSKCNAKRKERDNEKEDKEKGTKETEVKVTEKEKEFKEKEVVKKNSSRPTEKSQEGVQPASGETIPPVPAAPPSSDIQSRKDQFCTTVRRYESIYGGKMITAFLNYWTELNKSQTKMRWELERTWETPLRLSTWSRRDQEKKNAAVVAGGRQSDFRNDQVQKYTTTIE